ncbi:MAG: LemA family protein [Chromatiales bacterium]|nr:MAG: LemA family protein [Chromatiales bacterium]
MSGVVLIIGLALIVGAVFLFNRLVKDRNRVRAAWSDIDVQLIRRHELVPRLVEAVKAYAAHERATLAAVTELRNQSEAARRLADKAEVEDQLEAGVHKLILLAEAYPDLKANRNFLELQAELVEIEDHLQYARRFYNGAVRIFNTRIETVPDVVVAKLLQFQPAEFFGTDDRAAPQVSL